ncbi:type VI secretion system membrane subunit TssM [Phyllobacterium sp. YR531]|uniref:type VI secretion system membrane subunit TssM n=1 Tax=Phyllobacterium sp. YR531 TaxID=1144343 RepID=UPI00026FBBAF|nr:type VI secretion system membrane subunit TssM [Phyllobacterium sp. YR531]EJM97809.1 type VI secretion protein IcmF [Phyllobacterium sp. YR531]
MNILNWLYTIRSYLEGYAGFLKGGRFWSLIWVVAISVMIWFYGESIAFGQWRPLETEYNRLVAIGVVVLAWLIYVIVSAVRRRRAESAMIDAVAEDGTDSEADARDEVALLRQRLKDALLRLKSISKKRFGYVYDFPWYLIIGSPGSGKTTALVNSGLSFPFADEMDEQAIQGVGGTRACDWWFTDEAVLIDTAGRYTTQDSDVTVDSTAWQSFLGLLKRHRPLKPINGVIVTISMADMLTQSAQARFKEVRIIKQRLRDLEDNLKVRLPVYLVFTKVDMLAGFGEFFDNFNKFDREQVLGVTFPLGVSQSKGKIAQAFSGEIDLLLERMHRILLERMQQEPDDIRRSSVFRFPAQFASIKNVLVEQIGELTASSKLVGAPLLRGVYFVSATQTGAVYDKVGRSTSERFSFLQEPNTTGTVSQKAFFLSRLFNDVIFGEANLVTTDLKVQRRKRIMSAIFYLVPLIIAGGLFAGWAHAYFTNQSTMSAVNERIASYNREAISIPVEDITTDDLNRILSPLNTLRGALTEDIADKSRWYHFGTDQEEKLRESMQATYARGLNGFLLPRLLVHLQNRMNDPNISTGQLYDTLKLYSMLGGLGPLDEEFALRQLRATFETSLPGAGRAQARENLLAHSRAMLLRPLAAVTLDDNLIKKAQEKLSAIPRAQQLYELLVAGSDAIALQEWRPVDKAGPGADVLFARQSRTDLRQGIPGVFTRDGYFNYFLPRLAEMSEQFAKENWVIGEEQGNAETGDDLKINVLRIYFNANRMQWAALLNDLTIRPAPDLIQAAEIVRILASNDNPLHTFATAVADATNLDPQQFAAPEAPKAQTPKEGEIDEAQQRLAEEKAKAEAARVQELQLLTDGFETTVLDPYAALRKSLQAPEGQKSEFSDLSPILEELSLQLSRAAINPGDVNTIFGVESKLVSANQMLVTQAQRLPEPVSIWIGRLATDIARLTANGARQSMSAMWQSSAARLCKSGIENRYPFNRKAVNDVAINDFIRMFGPSGEFATFFQLHLKPFVDVSQSPWRLTGMNGAEAIPSDALVQFENAQTIQSAFFSKGGNELSLDLDISPNDLDSNSTSVSLDINGKNISYDHGPPQTQSFQWPGEGNRSASIAFNPPGPNSRVTKDGPWAMFHLFDLAQLNGSSADQFTASFRMGGRRASFDVRVGSILNPFALEALRNFKCPEGL